MIIDYILYIRFNMSCESFDLDSISQLSLADSSVDIFKSSFANSKSISSDNIPQVEIAELRVEDLCSENQPG